MVEGRRQAQGQAIPIATAVADAAYCFMKYEHKQESAGGPLLVCAGREKCLADYHVERVDHHCDIIEFVSKGKGCLQFRGESHILSAGHIFSYGMDSAHDLWSDPADPMTKYFAAFHWESAADASIRNALSAGEIRWSRDTEVLTMLFEELITEGQQSGRMHEEITTKYLELILFKAAEALLPEAGSATVGSETYDRVVAAMTDSFADIGSLEELGKLCQVEPNYICRLFRKYGQETPIQRLTRLKLNRAAELLLAHSRPVNEIAREVGYADPFYFSRVFKKRFGCSPKVFRESGNSQGKSS